MSKLKGMRTYLAGAMDRVPDGGTGWRNRITPMLKSLGVTEKINFGDDFFSRKFYF